MDFHLSAQSPVAVSSSSAFCQHLVLISELPHCALVHFQASSHTDLSAWSASISPPHTLHGARQSPSCPSRPGIISSGAPTGFPGSLLPDLWASPMYTIALILGFIGGCDGLNPDFGGQGPCLISLCPEGFRKTLVSE